MSKFNFLNKNLVISLFLGFVIVNTFPNGILPAFSETKFPLSDTIKNDKDLVTGKLPNGFSYIIKKNSLPEKHAEFRLVVKAGSLNEEDSQQGLAHFAEHMQFNGLPHFKKHELVSYLQSIGIKFGADLNAFTTYDRTVYQLPLPVSDPKILEKGFQILEDWAGNANLENSEIDKERNIILEESRTRKGVFQRVNSATYSFMYKDSKYPERNPIGKEEIIKNFKYDELKRFYHDWYRPDLMCLVVVGDIEPKEIESKIKEHFSNLKMPLNPKKTEEFPIPFQDGIKISKITDSELDDNILEIFYRLSGKEVKTFGDLRHEILIFLFSSMFSDRLDEISNQQNTPFSYAYSSYISLLKGFEGYIGHIKLNNQGIEPALNTFLTEIERIKKYGFWRSIFLYWSWIKYAYSR